MDRNRRLVLTWVAVGLVAFGIWFSMDKCLRARLRYGVDIAQCPDGDTAVGAELSVYGLRRGQESNVTVDANLLYALPGSMSVHSAPLSDFDVSLKLSRGDAEIPIVINEGEARRQVAHRSIPITLPKDLGDGDYVLSATVTSAAGSAVAKAPLAIYAPAKIHVVTDRPLYEPGNTMMFRAVVVRARDLAPLDGRPGRFIVTDPSGVVVLDERRPAGEFGIADGDIPLDKSAPEGVWRIAYVSGDAKDEVSVDVRPFTLPRFTVSVEGDKAFYGAGDVAKVAISAKTAAGVPMAAKVRLDWRVTGPWPAPPEWVERFPKSVTLPANGRTTLSLPPVPADLMQKASVVVVATAADDTGDEETGSGVLSLSKDKIDVSVVTELGQGAGAGLVEGTNNRVYLRATTASGAPLPGATVTVTRAWDRKDKGVSAVADVDGVVALQIDPGPAVNIVIPPLPVRLPPPPPEVQRTGVSESVTGDVGLATLTALDRLNPEVGRCSRFVDGEAGSVTIVAQVEASGLIKNAYGQEPADRCVAAVLRGRSVGSGGPRLFTINYTLRPSLASLDSDIDSVGGTLPDALSEDLEEALADARTCLGRMSTDAVLPRALSFELVGRRFSSRFVAVPRDDDDDVRVLDAGRVGCVEARVAAALRDRTLSAREVDGDGDDSDAGEAYGLIRLSVRPVLGDERRERRQRSAQTRLGYELLVTATTAPSDGKTEAIGSTKVFVAPGVIPNMRLRANPVVAKAGDTVTVDLVRGPNFSGELPKTLWMRSPEHSQEVNVDLEKKRATFTLPKDKSGWFEVSFSGAMARVFVPKQSTLSVAVSPDKAVYRPGENATLSVQTLQGHGDKTLGVAAAVGLFGVDETLGQLATLTPPSSMDRLVSPVQMRESAFGVLDAMALSLGRVRGENAAAATVLFVSSVPSLDAFDTATSGQGSSSFDPVLPLADRFFGILDAASDEVRRFEREAPKDEKLTSKRMLSIWATAVKNAGAKGKKTTDVFGRPLSLKVLPDELVAMADPRLLVRDGTRLPEDVEAWVPFVRSTP